MTSPLPRVRSTNWAIRAWKTYCLMLIFNMRAGFHQLLTRKISGEWRIRTSESFCYLIYSQTPLATWVTHHLFFLNCCQFVSIFEFLQGHSLTHNWADNGARTHDLPLTRRPLCQLSYVGVWAKTPFAHIIITGRDFLSSELCFFVIFKVQDPLSRCHKTRLYYNDFF